MTSYLLSSIFDYKIIVMSWKYCNTATGNAATGSQYFKRAYMEEQLWARIRQNQHIRYRAPRRTGKTSILKYMAKNPIKHYRAVYEEIESISTTQDFYIRMIELISTLIKPRTKLWGSLKAFFADIEIKEIGTKLKIDKKDRDYKAVFLNLIHKIERGEETYVLMLDEFPDMLMNVALSEGNGAAKDILDTMRAVRLSEEFDKNFKLILTGSVSLLHVVRAVSSTKAINDLSEITLEDMVKDEAMSLIDFIIDGASIQMSVEIKEYLLDKLQQYVPYYIQLIIEKCDTNLQRLGRVEVEKADIDLAWDYVTKNNATLENWEERLNKYFGKDAVFLKKVLTICAHDGSIPFTKILDLAMSNDNDIKDTWKLMIDNILVNDGYLQEQGNTYTFISPLLRGWWIIKFPIVNS